jgi:hypothetical protein
LTLRFGAWSKSEAGVESDVIEIKTVDSYSWHINLNSASLALKPIFDSKDKLSTKRYVLFEPQFEQIFIPENDFE